MFAHDRCLLIIGSGGLGGSVLDFQSRRPGFKTTCCHFETWEIFFTPLCLCLSEETLKAIGLFYLGSMPGDVKDLTHRVNV